MQLHGYPVSAKLPDDLGLGDRFWYWRGASGRSYIHSVYPADTCPPLPGAVYVAVRRDGSRREALAIGRFMNFWDGSVQGFEASRLLPEGTEEIHVHLLARDAFAADAVLDDLSLAFAPPSAQMPPPGFHEMAQPVLSFA